MHYSKYTKNRKPQVLLPGVFLLLATETNKLRHYPIIVTLTLIGSPDEGTANTIVISPDVSFTDSTTVSMFVILYQVVPSKYETLYVKSALLLVVLHGTVGIPHVANSTAVIVTGVPSKLDVNSFTNFLGVSGMIASTVYVVTLSTVVSVTLILSPASTT